MQKMRKTSIKFLLFTFVVAMIAFVIASSNMFTTSAAEIIYSDVSFESEYCIGDEVSLPNVVAQKDGTEYTMDKALILPNGAKKLVSKQILSSAGKYSAVYSTIIDGVKYEKRYDFKVKQSLFEVQRKSGTAEYDEVKDLIELNLNSNNPFTFNSIIDLSNNNLEAPFLEMYTVSSVDGERDFEQIMITLTDADNEDNFINIRINAAPDFKSYEYTYYTAYVAVSVNGDAFRGQDGNRIHMGNAYGRPTVFSFSNTADMGKTPENDRIRLFYDAGERQIWVYGTAFANFGGLVVDFDSDDFYKEIWEGFTSNKCKLSLYAANVKTTSANIFITDIDGQDLSAGFVKDQVKPELNISLPEQIPFGIVGYEYEVFNYVARDDYGILSSSVNAYYDYYSNYPISLSIIDGKIYPKYQGYYTFVYKVEDCNGNVTEKCVDVRIDDSESAIPISISVAEEFDNCLAGTRVDLKDYVVSADKKYGEYQVKITATCGNVVAQIIDEEYFYVNAVGVWKIKYEVTDRLGRSSFVEKTFSASSNPTPIFDRDSETLPRYMISNKTYFIPDVKAFKYNENNIETITPSVRYSLNGANADVNNGKVTPVYLEGAENVLTVTYYIGSVEHVLTTRVVETIKDGVFDARDLFYTRQGSVTAQVQESGLKLSASQNSIVDFVTPILINNFELSTTLYNRSSLTVVLTDEKNFEQSVELKFVYEDGMTNMFINGAKAKAFKTDAFRLNLIEDILEIESETFTIKKYSNGKLFDGFDSKKMTVSFAISNGSTIIISKVANQAISIYTTDLISPMFYMDGSFERKYQSGEEVTIPVVYASDAISGESEVTVEVWGNGDYITSVDGTLLNGVVIAEEIKFVVTGHGYYNITYYMNDQADNPFELSCSIYVPDVVKPEVSVSGKIPTTAKVGDKISVPKSTVTDDISEYLYVTVLTIDPTLAYVVVKNGEIEFNKAGEWTIRFFAMDEEGNMTYIDYKVNVKEG